MLSLQPLVCTDQHLETRAANQQPRNQAILTTTQEDMDRSGDSVTRHSVVVAIQDGAYQLCPRPVT